MGERVYSTHTNELDTNITLTVCLREHEYIEQTQNKYTTAETHTLMHTHIALAQILIKYNRLWFIAILCEFPKPREYHLQNASVVPDIAIIVDYKSLVMENVRAALFFSRSFANFHPDNIWFHNHFMYAIYFAWILS